MNQRAFRRQWLRQRDRYERRGAAVFRRALRKAANRIPFDNLDKSHYKLSVDFNITQDAIEAAYFGFYLEIGVLHGKRIGREINKELKAFDPGTFEEAYREILRKWLLANGGQRITSVRQGLVDYLIKYIAGQIEEGLTMPEISANIQRHILSRGFYRWQIQRIVRTETTAAANHGAIHAGKRSGVLIDKAWISATDPRTRQLEKGDQYDHLDMNGVVVPVDEPFKVPGIRGDALLDFPGDPTGPAGAVINCRCAVAKIPRRDANGRLIFL